MLRNVLSLPKTVWALGTVSLLNDAASDLVYPLLPLYLASVLMTGPGALGLIEGLAETVSSLLKLLSGLIADRIPRCKPLVVIGYALAALSRPLIALATIWPAVLLLRFMDRVGKGLRSAPRDAILAACVVPERRGLAFGLQRGMDNAGAVIGPVVAWLLLANGMAIHEIILWTAVPGALTVMLAASVQEPERATVAHRSLFSQGLNSLSPQFRRYLLVLAIFSLGNSSNMFLLLKARDLGMAEQQIPLLWGLTSLVATVLSTPLSGLSDRLGRIPTITIGWLVYAGFYVFLGSYPGTTVLLWPAFAVYGVFLAATEGTEKALVADLAQGEQLGTAYGWFNLTTGITLLPASLLFGLLWETAGPSAAFGFAAACALLAAILLWRWVGTKP